MSEMCYKCFKPKSACLCSYTKEIDPGIKFVLLMHQKEAKRQRTGTGLRLNEALSLRILDLDFDRNEIIVRHGKGGKDRHVIIPRTLICELRRGRQMTFR